MAPERKFAAQCAQDLAKRTGLHTANALLTVLLLRVPKCRVSLGRHFHKDKVRWSSKGRELRTKRL